MLSNESDAVLVQAARKGDRSAFSTLFNHHQSLLRSLCRRTLDDGHQADDIVQDAAVHAMLNLDHLRDERRFGPWLCGIGLNLCRRWLRERSRPLRANWSLEVLSGGRWAVEPVASGPGPLDIAEEADLAARVRLAVANLPRGQRASVVLFYLTGLTYAETAAQLGIEVSAVKTRLNKARRALRRQLDDLWVEMTMEETKGNEPAVPTRVADVRRRIAEGDKPVQFIVILEEIDGERRLPIWMGESEAIQIALHLENLQWSRPHTYTFTSSLLHAIRGRLREVIIARLDDSDVFYAVAVVEGARKKATVDARPSDAINLALSMGAPIRVHPSVFAAALAKRQPGIDPFGEQTQGVKEIIDDVRAVWKESLSVVAR
jgi:RNA polymerase sigma-70 factor (ECF subfamily)